MQTYSKIIVTGADGWLGTGLLNELLKMVDNPDSIFYNCEILALLQSEKNSKIFNHPSISIHVGDLRDEITITNLLKESEDSIVFNLAGVIHPNFFGVKIFNEVNHIAISRFANEAVKRGVRKFIAMSSNSPCGYSKDTSVVFNEDSPYSPYMGYGHSKMLMEKSLLKISSSSKTNFTIIRSPWFYGPFQPERQTEFFSMIKNGNFPLIGGGNGMRSMAYIDNIIQGLVLSAEYFSKNGEIFWISDKKPYAMKDIVLTVKKLLKNEFGFKVSPRQIYLPSTVSDVARFSDYISQSLGLYIQKVHVLSEMNQTISCSSEKAEMLLDYIPKIDLEEGMRRSISWCIKNKRKI
ncbi:NAD(P)-dependent oxidoreductase [Gammaproteobacteria bacterium]|nr:NAD(P)-dependent oxidoreductase [Gammaproteobacteria bacterium]